MEINICKGQSFKHKGNFYVVDTIDVYENITLIFTKNKKYIPYDEIEIFGVKEAFSYLIDPSKINERDELLMKSLERIKNSYPKKKTITEYLLSLLLNLFPKVFRL